jgi:hypothetical protein
LLAYCRVGLIPFTMGPINDAVNPVKLYAYALHGKPVVGSAIRELQSRPDVARTGRTPEEFAQQVGRAVAASDDERLRRSLIAFALENTWDHRARQALARLMPDVFLSPSPLYSTGVRGQRESRVTRGLAPHPHPNPLP